MEIVMTNETVIVIDDDEGITELFSELLQFYGMCILGVGHDGIDALQLFKKHSPDLVFMDINMPRLNGMDVLIEIKKIPSESKVIIVTSDTSPDLKIKLEKIGADAIIHKPFNMEKIIKMVEGIRNSSNIIIQ